ASLFAVSRLRAELGDSEVQQLEAFAAGPGHIGHQHDVAGLSVLLQLSVGNIRRERRAEGMRKDGAGGHAGQSFPSRKRTFPKRGPGRPQASCYDAFERKGIMRLGLGHFAVVAVLALFACGPAETGTEDPIPLARKLDGLHSSTTVP